MARAEKHPQWNSGNIVWIVQAAGETNAVKTLIEHLQRGPLAGQVAKFRTQDAAGTYIVATLQK